MSVNTVQCRYCRKLGHYKTACPKLVVDPAYASAMKKGLGVALTKEEQRAVDVNNRVRTDAAKRHKVFLERQQLRKEYDATRSVELLELHGPYWYRIVKDKKEDTDVARFMRQKEEEQQMRKDEEYLKNMALIEKEADNRLKREELMRDIRRTKMTEKALRRDEHKQATADMEEWEAYCTRDESARYYAACFRA